MRSSNLVRGMWLCVLTALVAGCADTPTATALAPTTAVASTTNSAVIAQSAASAPPATTATATPVPAPTPAPSPTPQPLPIVIESPIDGATLNNPFDLSGQVLQTPVDGRLVYVLADVNGSVITSGTLPVNGEPNGPGTFNASITYPHVQAGGALVRIVSVDASASVAVQLPVVSAQPQDGLTLNLNGVASKAQGQVVPSYVNTKSYIDLDALPEHLRVLFDDDVPGKTFDPRARQLLVIPLPEYRQLFGKTYAEQFEQSLQTLQAAMAQQPLGERRLSVLPASDVQQALVAQLKPVSFEGGSGVRFVTQHTQEISPTTSANLTYVFQGMTNDGAYFIAGFFPIASNAVPLDASQVTKDERDFFKKDYLAYIDNIVQTLDANPQSFSPSLGALDAMIGSLKISANPLGKREATPTPRAQAAVAATGKALELLNVRAAPNTRGRIVARLRANEQATLIGRTANSQWLRVRTANGVTGWVSRAYVDTDADVAALPVAG